jgi:chromosome segregation ATPase
MFSQLIDATDAAANAVAKAPLPPQAQALRTHAGQFRSTLEPPLRQAASSALALAAAANSAAATLAPVIARWRGGDNKAQAEVAASLSSLLTQTNTLLASNQTAFQAMSSFRDSIFADQRALQALIAQLQAQQAALQAQINEKQHDLDTQRSRLRVLQLIPFPLPWVAAEIANLITKGKTIEQELSQVHGQLVALQGQMATGNQALGVTSGFAGQLNVLENSLQNLLNMISVMQGSLQQIVLTVSSGGGGSAVVASAYLATLKSQTNDLSQYLSGPQAIAA